MKNWNWLNQLGLEAWILKLLLSRYTTFSLLFSSGVWSASCCSPWPPCRIAPCRRPSGYRRELVPESFPEPWRCSHPMLLAEPENSQGSICGSDWCASVSCSRLFGTDSDQNRMLEEIPRSGADSLPLIKPLRRTRTLCGQTQTQVWSESSVDEHNLYFARPAIVG